MKILFSVTLMFLTFAGFTQQCLSDFYYEKYQKEHPELQAEFDKFKHIQDFAPQQKTNGVVRIIPVVFHVIHQYGIENISKAQIDSAMRILNEDFRKKNPDTVKIRSVFKPYAADCEIEFRLAKIDPNGNCTEGIERIYSDLTNNADDNVKDLSWWDNTKYLNIWVVKSIADLGFGSIGTILGYAQFPTGGLSTTDGVVVRNDCLGRTGTELTGPFSSKYGRVLTHEVGHWLGLLHTFQSGCNGGDQVGDTPPVEEANYGCIFTTNSCTNFSFPYISDPPDMIENYMDYSGGTCQTLFSAGQKARMNGVLASSRSNIISQANLAATGVDGNGPLSCVPVADFIVNKTVGCTGMNFTFTDLSYNGTITNWNWTFNGATTPNSTLQNPAGITWSTPGTYSITLNVTTSKGSNALTRNGYLTILSQQAVDVLPLFQGFEKTNITSDGWLVEDGGSSGVTWQRITSSKRSGAACYYIDHYSGTLSGEIDAIISKSYNFTNATTPLIYFYTAYAQRQTGINDGLKMYVSTDCGQTWQTKISISGSGLAGGVGIHSSYYIPLAGDWIQQQYDLSPYAGVSNIRFRFETSSREGNNIYIDDINVIDNVVGINEIPENNKLSFQITPNPSNGNSSIQFYLTATALVSIKIIDMMGKEVVLGENKNYEAGNISIPITTGQLENLAGSVYFITLTVGGETYTRKFVKL